MVEKILPTWNGVSVIQTKSLSADDLCLFMDASSQGVGGYFQGQWFSSPFLGDSVNHINDIAYLESLAVLIAVVCWSSHLRNKKVVLFCDNEAIVKVWLTGSSKNSMIMKLVRELFFVTAKVNCNVILKHIPGKQMFLLIHYLDYR